MNRRTFLAFLMLAGFGPAGSAAPARFLQNGVTAHRGNSGEHPENTLAAFRSGIEVGADWLELDVFRTRDGVLVVTHDRTTGRVGDRDLSVPDSTYEQLKAVDVAADFRRRNRKTPEECPPAVMPRLEEVLRLVKGQQRTRVSLQPKMDCVDEAVALVDRLGMRRWVGFNDGNLAYMSRVKELAPDIPVFWDRGASDVADDLRIARERRFEALVLRSDQVTAEKVRQIRAAGLEAGAWTVNDPAEMRRMLELGVQRIYTDYPRRLLALRAELSR